MVALAWCRDLYNKAGSSSPKFTVPILWDKQTGAIVNNESSEAFPDPLLMPVAAAAHRRADALWHVFADHAHAQLRGKRRLACWLGWVVLDVSMACPQFNEFAKHPEVDLYPEAMREAIEEVQVQGVRRPQMPQAFT